MRLRYILIPLLGVLILCLSLLVLAYVLIFPLERVQPAVQPYPLEIVVDSSHTNQTADRVAFFRNILQVEPPTSLRDAHYLEVRRGDGVLGPADYQFYARLDITPEDAAAWQHFLQPHAIPPPQALPNPPALTNWWGPATTGERLDFYTAEALLGRQGIIALSPQAGQIYIYTFTT